PGPEDVLAVPGDRVEAVDVGDVCLRPRRATGVRPAGDDVALPVACLDQVASALPPDDVPARAADEQVRARSSAQDVVAGPAVERVARDRADEEVVPGPAGERVAEEVARHSRQRGGS